jgi:hypothetical protein
MKAVQDMRESGYSLSMAKQLLEQGFTSTHSTIKNYCQTTFLTSQFKPGTILSEFSFALSERAPVRILVSRVQG